MSVYDVGTNAWTTTKLTQARMYLAAASARSKVVFAGGFIFGVSGPTYGERDTVDILDTTTGIWSVTKLSSPRQRLAAAGAGDFIVFAGGWTSGQRDSAAIDIYNANTGAWVPTTLQLSSATLAIGATGVFATADVSVFSFCGRDGNTQNTAVNFISVPTLPTPTTTASTNAAASTSTVALGTTTAAAAVAVASTTAFASVTVAGGSVSAASVAGTTAAASASATFASTASATTTAHFARHRGGSERMRLCVVRRAEHGNLMTQLIMLLCS